LHFWQVRGVAASGNLSRYSAPWWFFTPTRDAEADTNAMIQYDANGDGRSDLVVHGELYLTLSTGLARAGALPVSLWGDTTIQVGDLDGDGTSEIASVVLQADPESPDYFREDIVVLFGDATTPWRRRVSLGPLWLLGNPARVRGGFDFNEDGYGDLAIQLKLPTRCGPIFDPGARLMGGAQRLALVTTGTVRETGDIPIPVGDFDGDGRIDVMSGASDPRIAEGPLVLPEAADRQVIFSQRCDFNGDGRADLVFRSPGSRPLFGPSTPAGVPLLCLGNAARRCAVSPIDIPNPTVPSTLACLGDLDANGLSELYFQDEATVLVFELNGAGRFVQLPGFDATPFVEVGDTNADGRADVIAGGRLCTEGPPFTPERCAAILRP